MSGKVPNIDPQGNLKLETMLDFLQGKLSPEETDRTENILQADELQALAVEELEKVLEANGGDREKVIRKASGFKKTFVDQAWKDAAGEEKPGSNFRLWSIAASVLLILIPSFYLLFLRPPLEDRIFNQYLTHYADPDLSASGAGAFESALADYNRKEYTKAIRGFETVMSERPGDIPASFYKGLSHIMIQQEKEAIPYLESVISDDNNVYVSDAEWYLALAKLKLGEKAAALALFREISGRPGSHKEDAGKIVSRLE